jgi:hypothetical protein
MRKLYKATGGEPQRWESLGNLGTVKTDAAGIAYAVEAATRAARWRVSEDQGIPAARLAQQRPA